MYVQVRRAGNMTQGELYAIHIAQECVDQLRVQDFATITAAVGQVNYPSVNGDLDDTNQLFPRPLLHDTSLDYTGSTTTGSGASATTASGNQYVIGQSGYTFHTINPDTGINDDKVKVELLDGPIVGTSVIVNITINYLDTSGAVRQYRTSSLITANGLNS
jgi:hypothetical protein